jgi:23S rRNA pseudouridine2457 synthase
MIIAFHKPYGVLSQFTRELEGQGTLADFGFPKQVYPVGRLDMDSEGLLLLSDEKPIVDRLLNPKNAHFRTYQVQVEGVISPEALMHLSQGGLMIQGHRCLPCKARALEAEPLFPPRDPPVRFRKSIPTSWVELS